MPLFLPAKPDTVAGTTAPDLGHARLLRGLDKWSRAVRSVQQSVQGRRTSRPTDLVNEHVMQRPRLSLGSSAIPACDNIPFVPYAFRNKILLSMETPVASELPSGTAIRLEQRGEDGPAVQLFNEGNTRLVVLGSNYPSPDAAVAAGRAWRRHLLVALAREGIGADFGDDSEPWTPKYFEGAAKAGLTYGVKDFRLNVYEQDTPVLFIQNRDRDVSADPRQLENLAEGSISDIAAGGYMLTPQQELAYNLLHAAFFESNPETKNVTLVTAVEAIIRQEVRDDQITTALDELIMITKSNPEICKKSRDTITNALGNVKRQSISEAGQALASSLLNNHYDGLPPDEFFKRSYADRCKIVHGSTERPTSSVLNQRNPDVLRFVIDLLDAVLLQKRADDGTGQG
jgi:hypothetical protein